jgi:hypothetical protein
MKNRFKIAWTLMLIGLLITGCELDDPVTTSGGGNTMFTTAESYLASKAPKAQLFTQNADARFTIKSKNGLHYRFKPSSFKTGTGQIVTGQVDLKLTEYLTRADMAFSGVTTTAGSEILESGAMFNLTASQNGQELQLVDEYRVQVPTQDQNPNMIIFEGREIEDSAGSTIDWVESKTSNVVRDTFQRDSSWSDTTYDPGYYYTLRITFMSWCNLDMYWNASTGSPIRVKINQEVPSNTRVCVAFKDRRSLVYIGYDHQKDEYNSRKYNLPNGWNIAIIAIYVDSEKEELYYAWVDSQTMDNHLVEIDEFKLISEEDLEALVKTLQ